MTCKFFTSRERFQLAVTTKVTTEQAIEGDVKFKVKQDKGYANDRIYRNDSFITEFCYRYIN